MSETCQCLDHLNGTSTLFLVKRRDIDACHHFIFAAILVINQKDLAIALAKVKRDNQIRIVVRIGRVTLLAVQHLLLHVASVAATHRTIMA